MTLSVGVRISVSNNTKADSLWLLLVQFIVEKIPVKDNSLWYPVGKQPSSAVKVIH
jgi:hypothetical protein